MSKKTKKADDAIKAVAKEKGYTYIFDISCLLFAGGDDLNEALKAQLAKMRAATTTTTVVAEQE